MAGQAGTRLRERKQVARRVGVWLRYSDGAQVVRQASCRGGASSDFLLRQLALEALQRAWRRRTRIRSCRLVFDRLQRQSPQLPLFPEPGKDPGRAKVLTALDSLRQRFGEQVIGLGRVGVRGEAPGLA
jgi:DNA polymerase-4